MQEDLSKSFRHKFKNNFTSVSTQPWCWCCSGTCMRMKSKWKHLKPVENSVTFSEKFIQSRKLFRWKIYSILYVPWQSFNFFFCVVLSFPFTFSQNEHNTNDTDEWKSSCMYVWKEWAEKIEGNSSSTENVKFFFSTLSSSFSSHPNLRYILFVQDLQEIE